MRVFDIFVKGIILFLLNVNLFGCGSSGGDAVANTSKMRALQTGDRWTYDNTVQSVTNNQTSSYSSTTSVNMTHETLNGEAVIAATSSMDIVLNGSPTTLTSTLYMQQDSTTGDLLAYGKKNGTNPLITVTDRPLPAIWPGSWEAGKSVAFNIDYSDGTTESASYTILGQESVTTTAGTFTAWKVTVSGSSTGTIWFAPQLGYYVKAQFSGGTSTTTITLQNTNVTVP